MHIAGAVDTEGAGEEQRRNTATQTSKYKRHWVIDSIIHFAERHTTTGRSACARA